MMIAKSLLQRSKCKNNISTLVHRPRKFNDTVLHYILQLPAFKIHIT